MIKKCEHCGQEFEVRHSWDIKRRRFCSKTCAGKMSGYPKGNVPFNNGTAVKFLKQCAFCGKEFQATSKTKRIQYCSYSCSGKANGFVKGHKSWNAGLSVNTHGPISEETKKKIALTLRGRKRPELSKEKHPRWKGGSKKRGTGNSKGYRDTIFERDKYTCQLCRKSGGILNAHHIKRYDRFPELREAISNGITLCDHCHKLVSKKVLWLFGNSGAGKSYMARRLLQLKEAISLDGDAMRNIWKDLKFSKEDRIENNLRIARTAKMFEEQGHDVIISVICPYEELRGKISKMISSCRFVYIPGGKEPSELYQFELPRKYFAKAIPKDGTWEINYESAL